MNCQVLVMGNSATSVSDLVIGHHRLDDLIDAHGMRAVLGALVALVVGDPAIYASAGCGATTRDPRAVASLQSLRALRPTR